jgi:hypothetical protein
LRTRGVNRHGDSQRPLHARRAVSERDVSARPVCGVGLDQGRCERVGRAAPAPRATACGVTPFGGSTGHNEVQQVLRVGRKDRDAFDATRHDPPGPLAPC